MAYRPQFTSPEYGWNQPGGVKAVYNQGSSGGLLGGQAGGIGGLFGGGSGGSGAQRWQDFMQSDAVLPVAAALIAGPTFQQGLAGAFSAAGKGVEQSRKRRVLNEVLKATKIAGDLSPETQAYLQENPDFAEKLLAYHLMPASTETGLTPQWAIGPDGKWHQFLPSRSGAAKELQYPTGYSPAPPVLSVDTGLGTTFVSRPGAVPTGPEIKKDVAGAAAETEAGKAKGVAAADLPRALNAADMMVKTIDQALADPEAVSRVTGSVQSWLPNVSPIAHRGQSYLDQIQGGTFLQAYSVLKGGGQISENEGTKATAALNRLQSTGMSDADYVQALQEFRTEVVKLAEIARQRAGEAPAGVAPAAGAPADPLGIR